MSASYTKASRRDSLQGRKLGAELLRASSDDASKVKQLVDSGAQLDVEDEVIIFLMCFLVGIPRSLTN
jgi:hypothetical protein